MKVSLKNLEQYFFYLDGLRESGVNNMFGASSYLEEAFDLPNKDARSVLGAWMQTFSEVPAKQRAKEFLDNNKLS
jgi:hypothetical protein